MAGEGSVAIDLLMLPLLASLMKSRVPATLKCCHDPDVKEFGNLSITLGTAFIKILCIICLRWSDDRKSLVYLSPHGSW